MKEDKSKNKESIKRYIIGFILFGSVSFLSIYKSMLWVSGVTFCCSVLCLKTGISILFENKNKKEKKKEKKKEYNGKRKNSKKLLDELKKFIHKKDKTND